MALDSIRNSCLPAVTLDLFLQLNYQPWCLISQISSINNDHYFKYNVSQRCDFFSSSRSSYSSMVYLVKHAFSYNYSAWSGGLLSSLLKFCSWEVVSTSLIGWTSPSHLWWLPALITLLSRFYSSLVCLKSTYTLVCKSLRNCSQHRTHQCYFSSFTKYEPIPQIGFHFS